MNIVSSYMKAKDFLGRNSFTILDALCLISINERNDIALENKIVFRNFIAGIKNDISIEQPVLVVEPSMVFIRKWLRHNPAENRIVIFSIADQVKRNLLNVMFADSDVIFIDTDKMSDLFINNKHIPTNILYFGNHFASPDQKKKFLEILSSLGSASFRICMFDTDDCFENSRSLYNNLYSKSYIDRVWLLPTGIRNETVPSRKMLVSAIYGYSNVTDHKTIIYKYSLDKNRPDFLNSHFFSLTENSDILSSHSVNLRGLFRKEKFAFEAKSNAKRNRACQHYFSKEISFFYTHSFKNNEYRIRAYIKDSLSNKTIDESKVSVRLKNENEITDWLDSVYPYSIRRSVDGQETSVQKLITDNLKEKYSGCDITLKTLIYFSSKEINILPKKAADVINRFSESEITGYYLTQISKEMLADQIERLELPCQTTLYAMKTLFDIAVSEKRITNNPARELLKLYESESSKGLSEVRSAMGKKFLYKDELQKYLSLLQRQSREISLVSMIQLVTGLEPNISCALLWSDYKKYKYADYEFAALVVRRQLDNSGTEFLNFTKRDSYRIIPLPKVLSNIIDKERNKQLNTIAKGDEGYLASCSIIHGNDNVINGQTAVLAPKSLYKINKKMIKKLKIEEDIVFVPDDSGGTIETNLAYYKGNIFRSNFRHWALSKTGIFTTEEFAYLAGNKRPNTFSSNYCDYSNLLSLTKLYLKMERFWKEVFE